MSDLVKLQVDLSQSNFDKMRRGKEFQLKKEQVAGDKHEIAVKPSTAKKILKSKRLGKGVRVKLSEDEIVANMEGSGLKEFVEGMRKGARWVKKNVIDSDFYQSNIKPIVRSAVDTGISAASVAYPMPAPVADLAKRGIDKIGSETGAFGIRGGARKPRKKVRAPEQPAGSVAQMIAETAAEPSPAYLPSLFTAFPEPTLGSGCCSCSHGRGRPVMVKHSYYLPQHGGSFKLA